MNGLVRRAPVPPFLPSNLYRRHSIAAPVVFRTKFNLSTAELWQSSSFPRANVTARQPSHRTPFFFDFLSSSSSSSQIYTSLSEVLPSTGIVHSPTTPSSAYQATLYNRAVKQAAGAHRPSVSSVSWFPRRLWFGVSVGNPVSACIGFIHRRIIPSLTRAFDQIIRVLKLSVGLSN